MSTIKYINRLKRMDQLIRLKSTGNPIEFARKMKVSERNLFVYLADLRKLGAPLTWSSIRNSYVYETPGKLEIGFLTLHSNRSFSQNMISEIHLNQKIKIQDKVK